MDPDSEHLIYLFTSLFFPLFASPGTAGIVGAILLIVLLLLCSALISGSEVAFFSLTANDQDDIAKDKSKASNRITSLVNNPNKLLATILISNNFINIAIVIISDYVLRNTITGSVCTSWATSFMEVVPRNGFTQWLISLYPRFSDLDWWANAINMMITIVGVTFLLVLFGEVIPKVYARLNNVKVAKRMSGTLTFLSKIFTPVSLLLVSGTGIIEKRLAKYSQNGSITSRADIDEAIEMTVNQDGSRQEIDILKSIVKFGDVSVTQIMRSRVDVIAVDFRTDYVEFMKIVRSSGYSRIPVYDGDFDNVVGILYVKDLLPYLEENENFEWQELMRTNVFYVPEAKKIDDLLKEFQEKKNHMAIVVDEYGGSSGIVTLEDIMEEIIGEIKEEYDVNEGIDFEKIDNWNYVFEGKTLLYDMYRVLKLDNKTFEEVKGDSDSLAGLILETVGRFPRKNELVRIDEFLFQVKSVNKKRIEKIKITLPKA